MRLAIHSFSFHVNDLGFQLLLDNSDVELLFARADQLHVWHRTVLFAIEDGIDLFQGFAFGLHSVVCLGEASANLGLCGTRLSTYDEHYNDDIPGSIHHVRLPSNVVQSNGHNLPRTVSQCTSYNVFGVGEWSHKYKKKPGHTSAIFRMCRCGTLTRSH